MSILAVGSVAIDSVETPFGHAERVIGGSAVFFSDSASLLTEAVSYTHLTLPTIYSV